MERTPEHILVVAGPGGAGKSTFITMLASGTLPEAVLQALPEGAPGWPEILSNDLRRKPRPAASSFVLHYDIAGPVRRWGIDYASDPALAGLIQAETATIVDIRLPRERLIAQTQARSAAARRRRGTVGRFWRRSFLRSVLQPHKAFRRRLPRKAGLYEQEGWLEELYAAWEAFLASLSSRSGVRRICVEPRAAADGSPTFALVGGERSAAAVNRSLRGE